MRTLAADLRDITCCYLNSITPCLLILQKWQKIDENLISHFGFELKQHEHLKPLVILNLILQRLFFFRF